MPAERTHERNRRITRRAVIVALLAATAATGAVFLIKQDARGASAAAAGGGARGHGLPGLVRVNASIGPPLSSAGRSPHPE